MKRMVLYLAAAAAAFGLVSCGRQTASKPEPGSRTGFAISFFKEVNRTAGKGENVFTSPYSAGVALSMLNEGAGGETKAEIDNALNGCSFRNDVLEGGEAVDVRSANSIWIDSNFSVRNRYVSLLQKDYNALVETLRFSDTATVRAINNWCSENTEGKIDSIVKELTHGEVMLIVNALYFKAPWENSFDPSLTAKADFNGLSKTSKVDMMYRKATYNYAEFQGCQFIELPYQGEEYSMFVVLPPEDMKIDAMLPYLNEKIYEEAVGMLTPVEVKFRMPKLKIETEMLLNRTLQNMGAETMFTSAADLTGISESGPLAVSEVKQKCWLEVSEEGTEAAAVTSIGVRLTAARPDFNVKTMTVDRPYVFFIADKDSLDILFAGKIVNL